MSTQKFAKYISLLFGQFVLSPIVFVIIFLNSGLNPHQEIMLYPSLLLFLIVIPLGYLFFAKYTGRISDFDLTNRRDRYVILPLTFICFLISCALVYLYGNVLLLHIGIALIAVLLVTMLITYFYKISLHASINVITILIISFLLSWKFLLLFITTPFVLWARYYLKKHTVAQLIWGVVVSSGIFLGCLYLLGNL